MTVRGPMIIVHHFHALDVDGSTIGTLDVPIVQGIATPRAVRDQYGSLWIRGERVGFERVHCGEATLRVKL